MSLASGDASEISRSQRKLEREERKRRAAKDSIKPLGADKKAFGKDDKRTRKDVASSNGGIAAKGHRKQTNSSVKRTAYPSYDKVNIIEKTAKFNGLEKEKGKQKTEAAKTSKSNSSAHRKVGGKFLDNLSKFESRAKERNDEKKTSFVRSHGNRSSSSSATAADPLFRRSYRPSRTTPVVDDPSVHARRSLRKERVSDSIAKLERKSSTEGENLLIMTTPSPSTENAPKDKSKSSRPSSASSSKATLSDSGSSTSLNTKGLTRAQQALERHRLRMRSSSQTSQNGSTSPGKLPSSARKSHSAESSNRTPRKSKSKDKDALATSSEELAAKTILVSTSPVEGDIVEVTTVTEVTTPTEGKMNVVVKELSVSEEDTENLLSPDDGLEYQLGDIRPMSVEDTVAAFNKEPMSQSVPLSTPLSEKPPRVQRKLPSIPTDQEPAVEPKSHSKRKKQKKEDGSGEPCFKLEERNVVVVETSPTFQESFETTQDTLNSHSPPCDQNHHLYNFNSNANSEPKSSIHDQNLLHDEKILMNQEELMKHDHDSTKCDRNVPQAGAQKEDALNQSHGEEAIKAFERLCEEVHFQPNVTKDATKQAIDAKEIVKDRAEDQTQLVGDKSSHRPLSLHIEEVLYVAEDTRNQRPKSISPLKRSISDVSQTPSPQKSPIKFRKSSWEAREFFERASEATSPEKTPSSRGSRTPSPLKFSRSLPKTPESPTKSLVRSSSLEKELSTSVHSINPLLQSKSPNLEDTAVFYSTSDDALRSPSSLRSSESPAKTPTLSESAPRTPSPIKLSQSPIKEPDSHHKSLEAFVQSPSLEKIHLTAAETPTFTPTPVRTLSPVKRAKSPVKLPVADTVPREDSQEPESVSTDPACETSASLARTSSPVKRAESPKNEMLSTRTRAFAPRYKKPWIDEWLEESDDDNVSLLSEAPSDASSIDIEWLGADTDDDDDHVPKQRNAAPKEKSGGAGVQRSASTAQDMMKMWEKKAVEKKRGGADGSPKKVAIESTTSVGDARATWESKKYQASVGNDSTESIGNGHSEDGSLSPEMIASTPSTPKRVPHSSSAENNSRFKTGEEGAKEMQEIFDNKVSGKIQGAKAMFENLTQSPKKSPSLRRSPRKRAEPRSTDGVDDSPVFSRKSSISDTAVTSRKSSVSQASESSDALQNDGSDVVEESACVDNMRAVFENQTKNKSEAKKHKTSLAEMVADDDCDITDVRSIKAMWESMDNGR